MTDLRKKIDAVVGFLRASGYFSLRPFLDGIDKVRVLIGIDVDKYIAQSARQGKLYILRFRGRDLVGKKPEQRWYLFYHGDALRQEKLHQLGAELQA